MVSEAQKRATRKYDAANTRQYHLKLNLTTDADIIDRLKQAAGSAEGVQGYIKRLIREDSEIDKAREEMEERAEQDLRKVEHLTFPAQDGYRDEEAIRVFEKEGHRMLVHNQDRWQVRIDVDAKKVLTVKELYRICMD